MSKIEYAWVIQRDDERFYTRTELPKFYLFTSRLCDGETFFSKEVANSFIERNNLQNCRPVKVEIKIAGE